MCPYLVSILSGQLYGMMTSSYSFTAALSSDIYGINWEGNKLNKNEQGSTKAKTLAKVALNSV